MKNTPGERDPQLSSTMIYIHFNYAATMNEVKDFKFSSQEMLSGE